MVQTPQPQPNQRQSPLQNFIEKFEQLSPRAVCLRVALFAAVVRVAYFATAHGGTWDEPILDADTNLALARQFIAGTQQEPFWQPPGFAWILSLILRVSDSLLLARMVFGTLSCVTVAAVTSIMMATGFRKSVAALGGALLALNAALLYYDGDFLPPSLATFFLVAALWCTVVMKDHLRRSALVGALTAFATLTVGTLAFALIPLAVHPAGHRNFGRSGMKHILPCIFAFGIALSPVIAHNHARGGGFAVALSGGINLWIGNNPQMNETIAIRPGRAWEQLATEPERALGRRTTAQEYDQFYAAKARAFCVQQPGACIGNALQRVRQLVNSKEIPRNESLAVARRQSPVLATLYNGVATFFWPWGILFVLATVGLFTSSKNPQQNSSSIAERKTIALLRWVLLATALGPLLFFVTGRYRVPMLPMMAMFAAMGAEQWWAHRKSLTPWILAGAATVATAWPMHLPMDRLRFDAEMHYLIAGAQLRRNDTQAAERSFRAALKANPAYLEAGMNLGLALMRQRRLADAFGVFDSVVQYHPENIQARLAFAAVSLDTDSFIDAQNQYNAILIAEPNNTNALVGQCVLALRQERRADAQRWHDRVQLAGGVDEADPPPGWSYCANSLRTPESPTTSPGPASAGAP